MNVFITSFESVAALLGIGVLGFWIIRKGIFPGTVLGMLSPLAIDIALPALVFFNIVSNFHPEKHPDWWMLPIWWGVFTGGLFILSYAAGFVSKRETRAEFRMSLFYQNGIFLPLVVLGGMFGESSQYLVYLFLFTLFFPAFFFSTYHFFFGKKERKLNWFKIINPVLVASLLAVGIRIFGFQNYVPGFILMASRLVGGMAIPSIMIIIGGNMYIDFQNRGPLYTKEVLKFILIKNVVFPLVFLGLLIIFQPGFGIALLILLESAVPPITAAPVVTEREGGNKSIVNQFVLASFVFCLFSISLMVTLFSMFFTP